MFVVKATSNRDKCVLRSMSHFFHEREDSGRQTYAVLRCFCCLACVKCVW